MTVTHRLSRHPLYERWKGMRARCGNPRHSAYPRYGERGVKVCERWNDFVAFLTDMEPSWPGPGHELHRIDNDGDYTPTNCVWLSVSEHAALPKSPEHRAAIGAARKGNSGLSPEQHAAIGKARRAVIDPALLRDLELSTQQVADLAGCGKSSVRRARQRLSEDDQ